MRFSCFVAVLIAVASQFPLHAQTVVTLSPAATPTAGQAGVTSITITGSGFPSGTILPADTNVTIELAAGGATAIVTKASSVTTIVGSTRRVTFIIPASISVSVPTPYLVSVSGTTTTGTAFASSNKASLTINPGAAISSVNPGTGRQAQQNLVVTITGQLTNFVQGATQASFGAGISVGGAAAGGPGFVAVMNSTTAMATLNIVADAPLGGRTVTVQTGTQQVSLNSGFTVLIGLPVITSVTPNSGQQGQALPSVAVVGQFTSFVNGTTVANFGSGITVNSTTVTDATHATASITILGSATLGGRTVTMTTGTEVASLNNGFTVGGVPVITSVTPSTGQQGQTLPTIAVVGQFTNFVNGTTVANFGAGITVNSTTVADATHATVSITILGTATLGGRTVTMTTGTEVATLNNGFTVGGVPVITSVTPSTGQQGQTLPTIAVVGQFTNFVNGTTVANFGAGITVNSTTVTDATHATVSITILGTATPGGRTVTMTTGTEVASLNNGFTVVGVPVITTVTPNTGQQGQTLSTVAVVSQFTNFVNGTTVANFGAGITVNSTTVTDATHATVNITILGTAALGGRTVTMTTGTEVASLNNGFTVSTVAQPGISDFNPKSGPVGTLVTISGTNLAPAQGTAAQVSMSGQGAGTIAAPVDSTGPASLAFTVPPGAATGLGEPEQ